MDDINKRITYRKFTPWSGIRVYKDNVNYYSNKEVFPTGEDNIEESRNLYSSLSNSRSDFNRERNIMRSRKSNSQANINLS
jgi:hypothetical protein